MNIDELDRERRHQLLDYALDHREKFVITQVANIYEGELNVTTYRMYLDKKEENRQLWEK